MTWKPLNTTLSSRGKVWPRQTPASFTFPSTLKMGRQRQSWVVKSTENGYHKAVETNACPSASFFNFHVHLTANSRSKRWPDLQPHCWLKWNNYFSTLWLTDWLADWMPGRKAVFCVCVCASLVMTNISTRINNNNNEISRRCNKILRHIHVAPSPTIIRNEMPFIKH